MAHAFANFSMLFSNPIRPEERKYGSVGRPVGNEVQIVDDHDSLLSNDETARSELEERT